MTAGVEASSGLGSSVEGASGSHAGANSVVRSSDGESCCPSSNRRFPHPLRQDLSKFLATRGMGVPAIRVLLNVFIGQHRLKRSTMQVQIEHIRGRKRQGGKVTSKQLVDHPVALRTNSGGRACSRMSSDDQTYLGSSRRQGNRRAIVERSCHAALWMSIHVIWSTSKCLLDRLQIRAS